MVEYEKRGYLLENFRLFHLQSPGGTNVEYHYHEFCKLLLLISGRGGYVVDGQRYILQPGEYSSAAAVPTGRSWKKTARMNGSLFIFPRIFCKVLPPRTAI